MKKLLIPFAAFLILMVITKKSVGNFYSIKYHIKQKVKSSSIFQGVTFTTHSENLKANEEFSVLQAP